MDLDIASHASDDDVIPGIMTNDGTENKNQDTEEDTGEEDDESDHDQQEYDKLYGKGNNNGQKTPKQPDLYGNDSNDDDNDGLYEKGHRRNETLGK